MKTVKINVHVDTGYVGSEREDTIDVCIEDGMTASDIESAKEDAAREWMFEQINWGYTDAD